MLLILKTIKKLRVCLIPGFIGLSINLVLGQGDYMIADSTISNGFKFISGSAQENSQYILVKKKTGVTRYTPEVLREYGFKNGKVYLTKEVTISGRTKKVFLEKLVAGKINLYYYTEKGTTTYFFEKDGSLLEVPKNGNDFRKQISKNTSDFEWTGKQVKLVTYNKKSLSKLISIYNSGANQPLPYVRFGVIAGYSLTTLNVPAKLDIKPLDNISFSYNSSFLIGFFADFPIYMTDFSINTGVNFTKHGFSVNSSDPQSEIDFVANISTLQIPALVRYTFPTSTWRPFVNMGGTYTYNIRNSNVVYESIANENGVIINEPITRSLISRWMYGFSAGFGLQRKLNHRKIASAELRFNQVFGSGNTLNRNQFDLMIGFSF